MCPDSSTNGNDQAKNCLVVDDHQLVAQAVGGLLSEQCGLKLVGVCCSVQEALAVMEQAPPDLLLLDLNLPEERWQDCRISPASPQSESASHHPDRHG